MVDVVGNPPVRISLWNGIEVTPYCGKPVAVMTYCDRGALFKTILDPELHWGDLYCSSRVIQWLMPAVVGVGLLALW